MNAMNASVNPGPEDGQVGSQAGSLSGQAAAPGSVASEQTPSVPVSRRRTLLTLLVSPLAWAWTAVGASVGALGLAVLRFLFPNVQVEPPQRFDAGPATDYPLGTVSTKWKQTHGVWIVHSTAYKGRDQIYALVAVCTHLGCIPNWQSSEHKFKCPCHGSGFDLSGVNFEGPAPRPLERCAIRLLPNGHLEVDKSRRFRQELGQWELPESYVDGKTLS